MARLHSNPLRWLGLIMVLALGAETLSAQGTVRSTRGGRRVAAVHASALCSIDDCTELRSYLIEAMVERVIEYRYTSRWLYTSPWAMPDVEADGPDDYTTTNNQETGVDELDIVKTDGNYIYTTHEHKLAVVKSWPAADTTQVASLELAGEGRGLLLHGDYSLVLSQGERIAGFLPVFRSRGTRIDLVDLSDRSAPTIVRSIELDGELVGARMIDGQVYVVLWTYLELPEKINDLVWRDDIGLPVIPWNTPEEERQAALDLARDILWPLVEENVAWYGLDALLPMMTDSLPDSPGEATPMLGCSNIYRPAEGFEYSLLTVLHLDLGAWDPVQSVLTNTGLLSEGWTLYTSLNAMYIAFSNRWSWGWFDFSGMGETERKTVIHKLKLGSEGEPPVSYTATGEVPGWLHNQFSMGEHEGYLRVATTEFDWWWGTDTQTEDPGSIVTVLEDDRLGGLVEAGRIEDIAPGEQIYAARFLGDKGYLVTFRQVDPLFTLDLSDPHDPQIVGELKIPGYSAYLHPVGENHLLAVGMDATDSGRMIGLQVSLFDVSDFDNPRLAHKYLVEDEQEQWSWSEALSDHHAFTFHRDVLSIPAYLRQEHDYFDGLLVFNVNAEDGISLLGTVDHAQLPGCQDMPWRSCYSRMRRSIYIEEYLYSLSTRGIMVNQLLDPEILVAQVPFE